MGKSDDKPEKHHEDENDLDDEDDEDTTEGELDDDDDDDDYSGEDDDTSSSNFKKPDEYPSDRLFVEEPRPLIPTEPSLRERYFEVFLVICSIPFPLATLILAAIRLRKDMWWEDLVNGAISLPPDFPCIYFRGRTFHVPKDEFPMDHFYTSLLPEVGTDMFIIICSACYIVVSLGILGYVCITKNHIKVIRSFVLIWAVSGLIVAASLMVTSAATTTHTTIRNQASYEKAVQSIRIFEAEMYGVVMTGEFGGKPRPVELSVNHLQKGISPFQAFRLREQCQALITIFQYCGAREVNGEVGSPTFVIRGETCEVKTMTDAGFCPTKSYFKIFIAFLFWTIMHLLAISVVWYFKCVDESRYRRARVAESIPVFHEAQKMQGADVDSPLNHSKDNGKQETYYSPSHPDQYERLKKYNQLFLRDFNKPSSI